MNKELMTEWNIQDRIHIIRGVHVMLDEDLAELYNVDTKVLNQAVKRNSLRFPGNFMFQLSESEVKSLRSQIVTSKGGRRYLTYAFTEQGVSMLSSVLRSETAVRISIQIMNAFVEMRRFIASNAEIFQRLNRVEQKHLEYDKKFSQVFDAISNNLKLDKGIFFDGQVFDAYKFVAGIIRNATRSIVLIDNYVDETVLTLFSKRKKNVDVIIYCKNISKELRLDAEKYNMQYPNVTLKEFSYSHDRFMIIDDSVVYHFGASLKDLGRKWFAFSKFDKEAIGMLVRLEKFK